jgi:hypothetical protein
VRLARTAGAFNFAGVFNPNDPRDRITHESFGVAPELIGLPLAGPWRRATAILADLLPVAILANAGLFVFLAFTSVVVVWRALSGLGRGSILRKGAATPVRLAASIAAFVLVLRVGGVFDFRGGDDEADTMADVAAIGNLDIDLGDDSIPADVAELLSTLGITQPTGETTDRLEELVDENRRLRGQIRAERQRADEGGGILRWFGNALDDLGIGFGWGALYFTTFTVLGRGQTPGKRLLGIRVIRLDGRPVGWWLSFERFGSYFASFSTGLLGFAQIFWDRNRQALHDKAVETVVIRMPRKGSDEIYDRLNAART